MGAGTGVRSDSASGDKSCALPHPLEKLRMFFYSFVQYMFIEHLLCHSGLWGTGVNVPVWLKSAFLREVGNK